MSTKHGSHWLEREDVGDVTVVRLKVPTVLDDDTAQTVFGQLYSLVSDVGRGKLVLDLAGAQYLPSLALGKLLMLNRKAQAADGRLTLCGLTPPVGEILEATHLRDMFDVYAGEAEALASFGRD
jgi:anti-sigma B factor antagonist